MLKLRRIVGMEETQKAEQENWPLPCCVYAKIKEVYIHIEPS